MTNYFEVDVTPDWEELEQCILRKGAPKRVHHIELFLDDEVSDAICEKFGIGADLDSADKFFEQKREIKLMRFLGYDYVKARVKGYDLPLTVHEVEDTAVQKRDSGREYVDMHKGAITSLEQLEAFPWPDISDGDIGELEWYEKNLPDDMCVIVHLGHFAEYLSWLMGYETLCYMLYDDRELVAALSGKLIEYEKARVELLLQFERVRFIWGSDDMGFRTGTLISPEDLREFVIPGHKILADMSHAAGRPYLLHSCGNLESIMDDLIDDAKIDAKHSFEDAIMPVTDFYRKYHERLGVLGGLDVDFLCRADGEAIRRRVRETLDICRPGGGYCLGTGNSVANYIPLDNYLAMMDEGRKYGR